MVEKIFVWIEIVGRVLAGLLAIAVSVLAQFSVVSAAADGWYDTVEWQVVVTLPLIPLLGVAAGVAIIATIPSMLHHP